jgi:ferrous iron transport protein B
MPSLVPIQAVLVGFPGSGKTSLLHLLARSSDSQPSWKKAADVSQSCSIRYDGDLVELFDLPGTTSFFRGPQSRPMLLPAEVELPSAVFVLLLDLTQWQRQLPLLWELLLLGIHPLLAFSFGEQMPPATATHLSREILRATGLCGLLLSPGGFSQSCQFMDQIVHTPFRSLPKRFNPPEGISASLLKSLPLNERMQFLWEFLKKTESRDVLQGHLTDWKNHISPPPPPLSPNPEATPPFLSPGPQKHLEDFDRFARSPTWGFPLFLMILTGVFFATFFLGGIPGELLHTLIHSLRATLRELAPNSLLVDLFAGGILSGVGGVLVFLPNIFVLFFCITFLEESGYFLRVARMLEGLMHRLHLSPRAILPMIISLGCNTPGVLATRMLTPGPRKLRVLFLLPFIGCSARLPLVVLLVGTFFPEHPVAWAIGIYAGNVLLITGLAKISGLFHPDSPPASNPPLLPPLRLPDRHRILPMVLSHCRHFWEKATGIVLIGTILVWFLQTFPSGTPAGRSNPLRTGTIENSLLISSPVTVLRDDNFLDRLGKKLQPVFRPLGFGPGECVALLVGVLAKEGIVSTLSVLYASPPTGERQRLGRSPLAQPQALAFLIFAWLYLPCLPTLLMIHQESRSLRFTLGLFLFSPVLAYGMAFLIPRILRLMTIL